MSFSTISNIIRNATVNSDRLKNIILKLLEPTKKYILDHPFVTLAGPILLCMGGYLVYKSYINSIDIKHLSNSVSETQDLVINTNNNIRFNNTISLDGFAIINNHLAFQTNILQNIINVQSTAMDGHIPNVGILFNNVPGLPRLDIMPSFQSLKGGGYNFTNALLNRNNMMMTPHVFTDLMANRLFLPQEIFGLDSAIPKVYGREIIERDGIETFRNDALDTNSLLVYLENRERSYIRPVLFASALTVITFLALGSMSPSQFTEVINTFSV